MIGLAWLVMAYRKALRRSADRDHCIGEWCVICRYNARKDVRLSFKESYANILNWE